MPTRAKYKRVLLKLSGEALCAAGAGGLDAGALRKVALEIGRIVKMGVQVGLVIGGGNIARGRDFTGNHDIDRATADYMGMLATIINGLALRDTMEHLGIDAAIMSPIADPRLCEPFARRRALELLEQGKVLILAGGTGSPFFTTDTCAALRACELGAEVLLKATKVDGVFDSDPAANPKARKYHRLTYSKVLADRLGVMDLTAISMCMDRAIPVVVFAMAKSGNLAAAVRGQSVGTTISLDARE